MTTDTSTSFSDHPDSPEVHQTSGAINSEKIFWPKLIPGTLIRRYKRFIADVRLENGNVVSCHCPNSGSMKQCCEPGRPVWISHHDSAKRKLKYTWQIIDMGSSLVGVNTLIPNQLVHRSIQCGLIEDLNGYTTIHREVAVGKSSRIDIMLEAPATAPCYIEVKNCTLVNQHTAFFPDAVTIRGQKHLKELIELTHSGARAAMFFLIQRMDARQFAPATHIDPNYAKGLKKAVSKGVEIYVYDVLITLDWIRLNQSIPFTLDY